VPAALVAVVSTIFGGFVPHKITPDQLKTNDDKALFHIAVIGRGAVWEEHDRTAAGYEVLVGADAAFRDTRLSAKLRGETPLIGIRTYNDENHSDEAQTYAQQMQQDPKLLAVIGHTSTDTTRATAEIYDQLGIPLIMPNVTGDGAPFANPNKLNFPPVSRGRLRNCFRLMPRDSEYQAPAIVDTILHRQRMNTAFTRVHFVQALSDGAKTYSDAIITAVQRGLQSNPDPTRQVDGIPDILLANRSNLEQITSDLRNELDNRAIIVFSGYAPAGRAFLESLEDKYRSDLDRPAIVLSDGCYNLETLKETEPPDKRVKFRIYTAASIDVSKCRKGAQDALSGDPAHGHSNLIAGEKELLANHLSPAPFIYGYDAMLIFNKAFKKCESAQNISRRCILTELQNEDDRFPSSCFTYAFHNGDSVTLHYYVFRSIEAFCSDKNLPDAICGQIIAGQPVVSPATCKKYSMESDDVCGRAANAPPFRPMSLDLTAADLEEVMLGAAKESK
jgi:ABC-type branched-subunit amino acid transport system substrate-binding protein